MRLGSLQKPTHRQAENESRAEGGTSEDALMNAALSQLSSYRRSEGEPLGDGFDVARVLDCGEMLNQSKPLRQTANAAAGLALTRVAELRTLHDNQIDRARLNEKVTTRCTQTRNMRHGTKAGPETGQTNSCSEEVGKRRNQENDLRVGGPR